MKQETPDRSVASPSPAVQAMRRLARTLAADPLRFTPLNAVERVLDLAAALEALVALAPFETLQAQLRATAPAAVARAPTRARVLPLVPRSAPERAAPVTPSATARAFERALEPAPAGTQSRAFDSAPLADAALPARGASSAGLRSLAERRRALRRDVAVSGPAARSAPDAVPSAPAARLRASSRPAPGTVPAAVARAEKQTASARPGTGARPNLPASASGVPQRLDDALRDRLRASGAPIAPDDSDRATVGEAPADGCTPVSVTTLSAADRAASAGAAGGSDPVRIARMPAAIDAASPATNATPRATATPVAGSTPDAPHAHSLADEFHETLYRAGVDPTWP